MKAHLQEATLLKTIAHPTRLAVLDILRDGEQCVCHMEARLNIRQASLSQQLMVLRRLGLVRVRRQGLNIFYRVVKPEIFGVLDALNAVTGRHAQVAQPTARSCPCPKCNRPPAAPNKSAAVIAARQ
jgi:DNA-binding transcriptional ArsR family regulator